MNELERTLAAAADDPAQRPAFVQVLLQSEVYVLGFLNRPMAGSTVLPGTTVNLVTWTDEDGPITPFFTSKGMLEATTSARPGTDPRFLRMQSRALFEMLQGQRLVLNPDGPNGRSSYRARSPRCLPVRSLGLRPRCFKSSVKSPW